MMSKGEKETSVLTSGVEDFSRKGRIDRKGWKNVRLGDCATLFAGGTPNRSNSDYYGGDIPWCSISDISGSGKFLVHTAESLTSLGIENSSAKVIPADSILFAMYASIGECTLATTPLTTSQAILGIYSLKGFDREYLYYYFCSQKKAFMNQGQTGTQSNLSKEIISNILLPQPDIKEQLRIANSLSLIDANIAAIQNLIHKYEAIKKSTVNLLLKPKAAWQRVKLGDVAETSSGGTPSRNEESYYQGMIPWFTTSELCDESLYDSKEHISQEALQNSSAKIFPKGTLLLAMYGATIGKLGVLTKPAATNQACCAIKCGSNVETAFLFQVLYSRRQEIIALGCGAGQPNISQQIIRNLDLVLPPLPEQRKIASQITAIDKVLNDCKKQLDKAKNLKQGMMSYFFG